MILTVVNSGGTWVKWSEMSDKKIVVVVVCLVVMVIYWIVTNKNSN